MIVLTAAGALTVAVHLELGGALLTPRDGRALPGPRRKVNLAQLGVNG
ncbi:MAG: hypothetical protein ACRDS9_02435 [Pseudonocardiaceae bacterium]